MGKVERAARRAQLQQEREARQREREAACKAHPRKLFVGKVRSGDAVEVRLDFTDAVTVDFDLKSQDPMAGIEAKVALQQKAAKDARDRPPD